MSTTVTDVDELEALLQGLSDDELEAALEDSSLDDLDAELDLEDNAGASAPVTLEGEFEAVAEPSPAKRVGKRKLKPLNEETKPKPIVAEEPVKPEVVPADDELDADDAELLELAAERAAELDSGAVTTVTMEELEAELGLSEEQGPIGAAISESLGADAVTSTVTDEPKIGLIGEQGKEEFVVDAKAFEVDEAAGTTAVAGAEIDDDLDVDALLAETTPAVLTPPVPASKPTAGSGGGAAAAVAAAVAAGTLKSSYSSKGELKTFIDPDKLQYDLEFTDANINVSITRQAALFSHYSGLAAKAQYQADRCKQQTALVEANLNQEVREELAKTGVKATEKMIDAAVLQHVEYQRALERQHEAKAIASMVESAADSFRHKRDMLQMRGTDLRREREGELRIREAQGGNQPHPGKGALEKLGA